MASDHEATFMGLSVEIRNQIYGYLLEEDHPIRIALTRAGGLARRGGGKTRKSKRGRKYIAEMGKWMPAIPIRSAIISVSHHIYNEAIHTLYGNNCFIFHRTSDVKPIVAVLGERTQLLRHIQFDREGYSNGTALAAFDSLIVAKNLRTIAINHGDFCPRRAGQRGHSIPLTNMVRSSKRLLQTLHASYQAQNLSANVLDVITMPRLCSDNYDGGPDECWFCVNGNINGFWGNGVSYDPTQHYRGCSCKCSEVEEGKEKLQRELRSLIAESLKIEDAAALK